MCPSANGWNTPPAVIPEDYYRESIEALLRALAKQSPPFFHREGRSRAVISWLTHEELGYFNDKKEKGKKDEVDDEEPTKIAYKGQFACLAPSFLSWGRNLSVLNLLKIASLYNNPKISRERRPK